jgi:hypothetical protein
MNTLGSRETQRAMTTFCWLPPDKKRTSCAGLPFTPSFSIAVRANARTLRGRTQPLGATRLRLPSVMLAATV